MRIQRIPLIPFLTCLTACNRQACEEGEAHTPVTETRLDGLATSAMTTKARAQPRAHAPSSANASHRKGRVGWVTCCCTVSKNRKEPGEDPKAPPGGNWLGRLPTSCSKTSPAPSPQCVVHEGSSRINSSGRKTKLKVPQVNAALAFKERTIRTPSAPQRHRATQKTWSPA